MADLFEQLESRRMMSVSLINTRLYVYGTSGADWLEVRADSTGQILVYDNGSSSGWSASGISRIEVYGYGGADTIRSFDSMTKPMIISGGADNDTIRGGGGGDWIFGDGGNDTLDGRSGGDVLSGGIGVDTADLSIYFTNLNITLDGLANDTGTGGAADNVWPDVENVIGGYGNDEITGSAYANQLWGGGGRDTLAGLDGNDTLDGGVADTTFARNTGNDALHGGRGRDYLYASDFGDNFLDGGEDLNHLFGSGGNDYMVGGGSTDIMTGGGGNDTMHGAGGNDWLYGEAGHDKIYGEADWDCLTGGAGDDDLYGGAGDDGLCGEEGDDGLFGGAGSDVLTGGADDDRFLDYKIDGIWQDSITDRTSHDARLAFVNGSTATARFPESTSTFTYGGGAWDDDCVQAVDFQLGFLHHATGNTRLLKRPGGDNLIFVRQGARLGGVVAPFREAWSSGDRIHLSDAALEPGADGALYHAIGHNWADRNASAWRALSGWTTQDKSGDPSFQRGHDVNATWFHWTIAGFSSTYARTNPEEDFAESFAAFFRQRTGHGTSLVNVAGNSNFIQDLINDLR
jgi:Ca2+-binding RTX toxin-like protein